MRRVMTVSVVLALMGVPTARAQQTVLPAGGGPMDGPRIDLAVGYHLLNANAPPGGCGCFTANGGFVGAQFNFSPRFAVAGEVGTVHASQISALGQNLMLTTYLAGPRVSIPFRRMRPFGEFMAGGGHAGDSYFPSSLSNATSASSFAYSAGGGLDIALNPRFSVRAFDASFLHTSFPNGVNGTQRQLQINAGVVMHLGRSEGAQYIASGPAVPKSLKGLSLSCSTSNQVISSGQPVHISAMTTADPDRYYFTYDWSTTGGSIVGHGNVITINTDSLQPGSYSVRGRAVLDSDPSKSLSCKVDFEVASADLPQSQLITKISAPPGDSSFDQAARNHLRDLFFNYDQSDLRPDAVSAVTADATYLLAHPEITITIAGYADERGSAEYNLALGMERAEITRSALVSSGIEPARIKVLSYGKERPFCSEETESCMQQNRRAQFVVENGEN